jgi:hypothetical protein
VVVELHGVERKLAEGLSWCGEGWVSCPRWPVGRRSGGGGVAVVSGLGCARQGKGRGMG